MSKNLKDWVTSVKKAEENTENSLELKVSFYNLSSGSLSLKILDSPDARYSYLYSKIKMIDERK